MAVITEASLRGQFKGSDEKVYKQQKGDILTPSAKQYLSDLGVKIMTEAEAGKAKTKIEAEIKATETVTEL